MRAMITTCHDPFHPLLGRDVRIIERGISLAELAPVTDKPFICLKNGEVMLRRRWEEEVRDGEVVVFMALPLGGGGGSNPLRFILSIALIFVAPYLVPAGFGAAGTIGFEIARAGIVMAGSALINALIPMPKPNTSFTSSSMPDASPTYNIQAQGNMARIEAPIPDHYGRMRFFPDFAAQPYTEYSGNEQYLYQLFVIGQGDYSVEQINIEDTPLTSWEGVSYEVIPSGGNVTMFPSNVASSPEVTGQEALYNTVIGPFVASGPMTQVNYLGVDVVFPQGLFYYDTEGNMNQLTVTFKVEACTVDDLGNLSGAYVVLGNESVRAATTTPQRYSYRYNVTPGRYAVKFTRTSTKNTSTGYSSTLYWAGLRSYLPDVTNFGNVTLLAMRLKASNQLSVASSRKINVIATRKIPTWHPDDGWSAPVATRSPAWAIANMLRADYGGKMPDSRIDLDGLYALAQTWEARHDYLDQRFDISTTLWAALTEAAAVGRARPFMQGGILYFKRDQPQEIPVAMYSMRNIERNSLSIDYLLANENTSDAVELTYYGSTAWAPARVTGRMPDSPGVKPAKVSLMGITGRDQAMREATYQAAANRYRREIIRFSTEMEGFLPSYGDLIAIQHDMPGWGQSAEALGYDIETGVLTLSEPMTFAETGTHYIGMRLKDGSMQGPFVVNAGATPYELMVSPGTKFLSPPYTGRDWERTFVTFGWGETWRKLALVTNVRPRGTENVEIECIAEDPSVHTAELGIFAPPVQSSQLPTLYTAPVVRGLIGRNAPDDILLVMLSWEQAPGAEYYIIEQSADSVEWSRVAETRANNFSFRVWFGSSTVIRVAAVGLTRGPWVTLHYGGVADYMWDANPSALMWDAVATTLMWR